MNELQKYVILMAVHPSFQGTDPISNVRQVASQLQTWTPIPDGSVQPQVGFGNWGVEDGVRIETATTEHEAVKAAVGWLLWKHKQECAYVEVDGEAYEWARGSGDGLEISPIVGHYD